MQSRKAAQTKIVAPNNLSAGRQPQIRSAAGERFEDKLSFNAGQRGAETEVTGPTKGEMTIIEARQVELIGIDESFGIAVARGHDRNNRLAFADELPAHLSILRANPRGLLAGTFITQQLFDSRGNERDIVAHSLHLFGVPHQTENTVTDQVRCGFLPADHSHNTVGDDLLISEAVAIDLGGDERVDQTFTRMLSLLADRLAEKSRFWFFAVALITS